MPGQQKISDDLNAYLKAFPVLEAEYPSPVQEMLLKEKYKNLEAKTRKMRQLDENLSGEKPDAEL